MEFVPQFFEFVHDRVIKQQRDTVTPIFFQQKVPEELPDLLEPAEWRKAS